MKFISAPLLVTVLLLGCNETGQDSTKDSKDKMWVIAHQSSKDYFKKKRICDKREPIKIIYTPHGSIGPSLGEKGRPAQWAPQQKYLGDTCFVASIGPYYYRDEEDFDPDYYSVEVEVRQKEPHYDGQARESWRVLYRRDFAIEDLPVGFVHKNIDDVVEFNQANKTVGFQVGDKFYEYRLPMH